MYDTTHLYTLQRIRVIPTYGFYASRLATAFSQSGPPSAYGPTEGRETPLERLQLSGHALDAGGGSIASDSDPRGSSFLSALVIKQRLVPSPHESDCLSLELRLCKCRPNRELVNLSHRPLVDFDGPESSEGRDFVSFRMTGPRLSFSQRRVKRPDNFEEWRDSADRPLSTCSMKGELLESESRARSALLYDIGLVAAAQASSLSPHVSGEVQNDEGDIGSVMIGESTGFSFVHVDGCSNSGGSGGPALVTSKLLLGALTARRSEADAPDQRVFATGLVGLVVSMEFATDETEPRV